LEQEARRLAAGRLLLAGTKNIDVVRTLGVSESSVKRLEIGEETGPTPPGHIGA
jgi:hypothetical protein